MICFVFFKQFHMLNSRSMTERKCVEVSSSVFFLLIQPSVVFRFILLESLLCRERTTGK